MSVIGWLGGKQKREEFGSHEQLFAGLKRLDNRAILRLQDQATPVARKLVREHGLPRETADELINRATLIMLRKIESGDYVFRGYAPSTYLVEVTRRLVLAAARSKKHTLAPLEDAPEPASDDFTVMTRHQEAATTVTQFLERLGDPCARVIRLFHIEGYADEEVVRRRMTTYSTVASLKVKRSDCMKKLTKIAQQWKTVNA